MKMNFGMDKLEICRMTTDRWVRQVHAIIEWWIDVRRKSWKRCWGGRRDFVKTWLTTENADYILYLVPTNGLGTARRGILASRKNINIIWYFLNVSRDREIFSIPMADHAKLSSSVRMTREGSHCFILQ